MTKFSVILFYYLSINEKSKTQNKELHFRRSI